MDAFKKWTDLIAVRWLVRSVRKGKGLPVGDPPAGDDYPELPEEERRSLDEHLNRPMLEYEMKHELHEREQERHRLQRELEALQLKRDALESPAPVPADEIPPSTGAPKKRKRWRKQPEPKARGMAVVPGRRQNEGLELTHSDGSRRQVSRTDRRVIGPNDIGRDIPIDETGRSRD
jgi:hypothetical protein